MRQSNIYIILYTLGLTVVCGVLLAFTAMSLKERQQRNVALFQKTKMLSSAIELKEDTDVEKLYSERVVSYVVDYSGKVSQDTDVDGIIIAKEYKKQTADRLYPVYEIRAEGNKDEVEFYVFPIYGFGLWDEIYGYIALEQDLNTIEGVYFDHEGETPGLGARIATPEVQERYIGKKVYEGEKLVGINMLKGEGNDADGMPHAVDGMSGATITAKGLNAMVKDYLSGYDNFISSKQKNGSQASL